MQQKYGLPKDFIINLHPSCKKNIHGNKKNIRSW